MRIPLLLVEQSPAHRHAAQSAQLRLGRRHASRGHDRHAGPVGGGATDTDVRPDGVRLDDVQPNGVRLDDVRNDVRPAGHVRPGVEATSGVGVPPVGGLPNPVTAAATAVLPRPRSTRRAALGRPRGALSMEAEVVLAHLGADRSIALDAVDLVLDTGLSGCDVMSAVESLVQRRLIRVHRRGSRDCFAVS